MFIKLFLWKRKVKQKETSCMRTAHKFARTHGFFITIFIFFFIIHFLLPAGFGNTWQFSFMGEFSKAESANPEHSEVCSWSPAKLATVMFSG
jgi:cytochrome b561